ncbi:MAG TPA: LysM peptidoglycan-binding domain-containing protein, partial [Nitrolancea sp.]|nr:LysM peptidoglycan-binding domain-containing protein [Nitrolancea sp.]
MARSIMVAMTIATVATGGLLSSSLASPSSPPVSEPSPEVAHGAASGHGESHRYTVRAGDTIADIAAWLGLPTKVLIAANDLPDPNFILPGQQLTIPAADQADEAGQDEERAATGGLVIPVEADDTIWGLSRRYEVDLNQIISYPENHITNPNRILPGQPLVIPGAHEPTATTSDQAGADDTSPHADQNDASATPPPSPEATPAPTPPAPAPSTSTFAWPVKGKMTQPFGPTSLAAEPADQG